MNEMNITYRIVGDYKIPNIALSPEDSKPIGRWGIVRRDYLLHNKSVQFNIMLMTGTLTSHLAEIDSQAEKMFSRLVEEMANTEEITEQLKEQNQLEWVQRMNNIRHRATEIVNAELIYV
ncbi:MAG: TnpV protein [Clostridia bacterium]|nr:TnpV protein [Clostridia bacterium]